MNRTFLLLALGTLLALPLGAQEVVPRITLAGRGLVSLNGGLLDRFQGDRWSTDFEQVAADFSDTHILLRLDRKIYGINRNQVAGTVLGLTFPDAESPAGPVYFSQAHFFWWSRNWELLVGRARLENFVVEFPTLRDDDLLDYAFVRNAFLYTEAPEYELYGNLARFSLYQGQSRWQETFQVASLTQTDAEGRSEAELAGIQMVSAEVAYRLPEPLRFSGPFRKIGLRLDLQPLEDSENQWLSTVTAGADINLSPNPLANWRLRVQAQYTPGQDGITVQDLAIPARAARARSFGGVVSLSFLRRPYQVPRLLVALTGALRSYPDQEAWRAKAIAGVFYQIGAEVDVGLQYEAETVSQGLRDALGFRNSHSLKFLFSFEYEALFNHYFTDRETLLNLEHGFAP